MVDGRERGGNQMCIRFNRGGEKLPVRATLCQCVCVCTVPCVLCHVFVLCHVYYVMSVTLCHVFYMAIVPCAMFALYLASNHLEYPHSFSTVCPRLNIWINRTGITGERHNNATILMNTLVEAVTLAEW